MKEKIVGFVPARMAASRFPGKPLHPIHGRPMVEHVFARAKLFPEWDGLYLATCDKEIEAFAHSKDWPVIMTSDKHARCLDRVAEAAGKCGQALSPNDIVICVQGDEPMLHPDMIAATLKPMRENPSVMCTVLAMQIAQESDFHSPDVVKLVFNSRNEVQYSSRAPIPHCRGKFSVEHGAYRIYGIFGFRWHFLQKFNAMPEGRFEALESCDTNRLLDGDARQIAAPYPFRKSFSVDNPKDIAVVEANIVDDPFWGKY
jgi:3-deoxy-manno-octulosonate cytidylyltransferase (CMP-KDO synthetase)